MDYKTILRHHLATLAFRTHYALKDHKKEFAEFSAGNEVRTPKEILHHIIILLRYPDFVMQNKEFTFIEENDWNILIKMFYAQLQSLDKTISELKDFPESEILRVYQGPLSDAMTHVGQLMMLRRLSGDPLPGHEFDIEESIQIGKLEY